MLCAGCGAPLKPDARFCAGCGAAATPPRASEAVDVVEPATPEQPPRACWSCDKPLKSGALFCPGCGASQDPGRIGKGDAGSLRTTRGSARPLVLGLSLLALVLIIGGVAAAAWWRFSHAPSPTIAAPPAMVAPMPAPAPVDIAPVMEVPAQPPADTGASMDSDVTTTDAAATPAPAERADLNAAAPASRAVRRPRQAAPAASAPRSAPQSREAARTPRPPPDVLCIRPDGSEVQTSRAACRAQGGVIY